MLRQTLCKPVCGDTPAVMGDSGCLTYRELVEKARAVQLRLRKEPGETIAVFLPNGGAYIAAFFGTLMAGRAAFPLSVQLTSYELAPLLRQASVRTVLTSAAFRPLLDETAAAQALSVIYMEDLTPPPTGDIPQAETVSPEKPMLLLSTSGTTGRAKIVQLSEKNVESSTLAYLNNMDYEKVPESAVRYVIAAPFSSAYGILAMTACVLKRFPIVLMKDAFTLDTLYQTAQEYRVTHYEGGVMAGIWMDQTAGRPIPYDIRSLRYFGLAGSKIPADTLERLMKAFPDIEFWTGYGMTEAAPLIAKPYKRMDPRKLASVGLAFQEESILIEADGTMTSEPYIRGEIVVKGPNVMLGYYQNEEETRKILKNGFLYTGDIGYLDDEGYLYICGRKKNVIIVRGFNVYPEEVEACILDSRLAADCVVYGETDAGGDEFVCADIVPAEQVREEDIRAYFRAHLSAHKQPRKIRLLSSIEKTATGKSRKPHRGGEDGQ